MKLAIRQLLSTGVLLTALLIGCVSRTSQNVVPPTTVTPQPTTQDVTVKQLLDNPAQYDGKPIRVIGYVYLEFEGEVISEGPATKYSRDIWLDITPDIRRNRAKYNQQYVLVEGTLNASEHGHMGMSRATIKSIKRFELANAKS